MQTWRKRITTLFVLSVLTAGLLCGCSGQTKSSSGTSSVPLATSSAPLATPSVPSGTAYANLTPDVSTSEREKFIGYWELVSKPNSDGEIYEPEGDAKEGLAFYSTGRVELLYANFAYHEQDASLPTGNPEAGPTVFTGVSRYYYYVYCTFESYDVDIRTQKLFLNHASRSSLDHDAYQYRFENGQMILSYYLKGKLVERVYSKVEGPLEAGVF